MNTDPSGIAAGGERRLRKAVEAQVRARHQADLAACTNGSRKAAIEEKIEREIRDEMKRLASPYSLWGAL